MRERGAPSHSFLPEMPRALASCSPVLEPVLRVLQPGLQVPDAHLLLLQGRQVLLRGGGLDAMVVTAQRVLHGAPARGRSSVGSEEGAWRCAGPPGEREPRPPILVPRPLTLEPRPPIPVPHSPLVPGPPSPPPAPCRPGLPLCPCGHENTRPFWKVGFIKVL